MFAHGNLFSFRKTLIRSFEITVFDIVKILGNGNLTTYYIQFPCQKLIS